jgi:hypothetical protein
LGSEVEEPNRSLVTGGEGLRAVGPVTEARQAPTLTLMGVGGEGPRAYEAG